MAISALHFVWGIGAFIAPLLVKPYLLPLQPEEQEVQFNSTEPTNSTKAVSQFTPDDLIIQWPYTYIAVFMALNAGVFLFLFAKFR